jgi:hypothetical protein
MGGGARVRVGVLATGVLFALAAACHRRAPPDDAPQDQAGAIAPLPAASTSTTPADHLGPDELVEGSQQAFGIMLPRVMEVKGSFADVVYATGHASVHALAQYFRARLQDGSMREGARAATFEHVKVRGKPGPELLVRIGTARDGASVEIRNSTPPNAPLLPDEGTRWRQVGLTPHGRLADPTHLD